MERGLLWLPLLALFIGLAWAGWNEYRKLEAYRIWAAEFDYAKFDIYSVLGLRGNQLTWGKPTRKEPVEVQTLSLKDICWIGIEADEQSVDLDNPPEAAKNISLRLVLQNDSICNIPFTQIDLALQWATFLQRTAPHVNLGEPQRPSVSVEDSSSSSASTE